MAHDERSVLRQAQDAVQLSLRTHGRVLPGAVILARRDPVTEAVLPTPMALAMSENKPFADRAALELFVGGLRAEARRLHALAIAVLGEAGADVEAAQDDPSPPPEGDLPPLRRVALIRMEDRAGVQLLHAPIERTAAGIYAAADFVASPEAPDIFEHPILLG